MPDGLSDALRQMATGEHAPPQRPPSKPAVEPRAEASLPHAPPKASSATAPQRPKPSRPVGSRAARLIAAALLAAMGLIMAGMGVWATMILLDYSVWRSDQPGASSVATGLLVTYPIAICMLAAAGMLTRRALKADPP
ncbi:hypothetical protein ACERK3_02875 [Phycisphaerales bacterium AB-hyl4]|uniref:Uncharacterized protein n=1 Tax=Natronomicrosphaera hydrolytica TaxID=3242702 RepID=A0ABV4U1K2_9BACT